MATLTVRNVPDAVVAAIKSAARLHQRSMEQELRDLLDQRYASGQAWMAAAQAAHRQQLRRTTAEEMDAWRRYGRE